MTKHVRLKEQDLELPEEIIQHIHSFMERKLAARTSSFTKSWCKAWSTRPNLLFYSDDFSKFCVTTTIQRYLDLNINLNKLELHMEYDNTPHVDKLIIDASELRVNVLKLYFWYDRYNPPYVLPAKVFANKYLKELKLSFCKIVYLIPENVLCSNLRSINLNYVSIDDSTFKDILARCLATDHLKLRLHLVGLKMINASELLKLKTLIVECSVLESPTITPSVICGRFLNLSRLVLKDVRVADSFFTNISSSFPKLEDLTLELFAYPNFKPFNYGFELTHHGILKMAKFDVPNIRNFEFDGDHIPTLSFTTSSKEWNSKIELSNFQELDLSKLREFLIKLGRSKITLHVYAKTQIVPPERNIENFKLPAAEELTFYLEYCEEYDFFVECLWSCRPKLVSLSFVSDYGTSIHILYMKLIERRNQNGFGTSAQYSSSLGRNELEEVDVEIFEESLQQWRPIKALSNDLELLNHKAHTLRFKLKWGSLTPEYTIIKHY